MEAYNSSSSSSSKSSYLFQNTEESKARGVKQESPFKFHSLLHSVRKSPAKSWKKAPVAPPMPPTPVKVYKVDAINFKDLVQQLTCAPEFMPPHPHLQLLQKTATSIDVPSRPLQNLLISRDTIPLSVCTTDNWYDAQNLKSEDFGMDSKDGAVGLLEMNLFSPASYGNWSFFLPIMSPKV